MACFLRLCKSNLALFPPYPVSSQRAMALLIAALATALVAADTLYFWSLTKQSAAKVKTLKTAK